MRAVFPGSEINSGLDMARRSAFGLFEYDDTNYKEQEQERKLLESNFEIKKLVKEMEQKKK